MHAMTDVDIKGFTATAFAPVRDAFAQNFTENLEIGAGFAAYLDGEKIIDLYAGHADPKGSRPWTHDTIVPVYSTTKAISALIIAMLVDRGLIDYEAPLAAYWPEFAAAGKGALSIGAVLSHQGGIPGFRKPIDPDLWLNPSALSAQLAEEPPHWPLGEGSGYHPLTWGYIVGELAQRAAGETLGTLLRQEVCTPLGIDFHIGTPASEHHRCAALQRPNAFPDLSEVTDIRRAAFLQKWSAPNRSGAIWREIEIPSANGHGTAGAVARLYEAYARKGRIGSHTLFSETTWQALTRERVYGPDKVLPFTISFAAGVMRNTNLAFGPNPAALGHAGWGGSAGLGDPERGLSAGYVMNRQSNILLGDPRAKRLFEALYDCL